MTNKYIDLTEEIWRADEGRTSFGSVSMVLAYLDEHPERVPGQTITESEMDAKWDEAAGIGKPNFTSTVHRFTQLLGFDVIPDPEPTNAEKATDDLQMWGIARDKALELGPWLAGQGWTKAPGGDDE